MVIIVYNLILTIAKITLGFELKLGQGANYGINGSFVLHQRKGLILILLKQT